MDSSLCVLVSHQNKPSNKRSLCSPQRGVAKINYIYISKKEHCINGIHN